MNDFRTYASHAVLRDGGSIHVRAIRPDDKQRLVEHFRGLSPRSVHFRFFGAKRRLTDEELVRFTELDFGRNAGLVATLGEGEAERIIGVGRYMSTAEHRAEVAFVVADEYQGRGIASLLLEHLAPIARANGVTEFEADVLGENNQMLSVFRKSGFVAHRSIESGVVHLRFPTEATEVSLQASIERGISASAESVRHFLRPASIAVVGGGTDGLALARRVVANLRRAGFPGEVHVVQPGPAPADDPGVFSSVRAVGRPIEMAVIALSPESVAAAVEDCAGAGVRAVVILSGGFAELADGGRRLQDELAQQVRRSGMRLIGPNCLGVIDTDPAHPLDASWAESMPLPGNVGMLVQSGVLAGAMLDQARVRGLGLSSFVSVGNKADVSGNDLLSYWMSDGRTAAIGLYLESFGNPRRFARIAPLVARAKPVVAVKVRGTARAGLPVGEHAVADALFQQAGVIRTDTIEELFGVLALLSSQPPPLGSRVGVVTNSSEVGALMAETCAARGLQIASLDAGTAEALRGGLSLPRADNPVDLGARATPEQYERAMATVAADTGVDAVIAVHIPPPGSPRSALAAGIARGAAAVPAEKPVLTVFIAAAATPAELDQGPRGRLPCYPFPENAALALSAAERYGRWRRRPRGVPTELDRTAASTIRAVVDRVRGEGDGHGWLEPRDFATVLRAAGIPHAESHLVSPAEAADFAETMGYPLVAKAVATGLARRTEHGCVVMGLAAKKDVADAVSLLRRRTEGLGLELEAVLLQREAAAGIEAVVEVRADPLFGPVIICGLAGVLVSLLGDQAVRLPPVTDLDAAEMIDGLRARALLEGYRGVGPGDRRALEELLQRLSALIDVVPEIQALELNPIKVLAPGYGVVVVDGRFGV